MPYATRSRLIGLGLSLGLGLATAATALTVDPVEQHNSNAVWFENWSGLSNAQLVVSAPNGKVTEVFAASGTPVFELERGATLDGIYRYELKAATEEQVEIANPIDNGRAEIASSQAKAFYMNGSFVVSRGVIITPEEIQED
ncbi:hypothetical protein [Pseudophaeobacter sp.]|uniref:hypothetical protein n=1 Tax=Pseudophaeobacter sp. TaxID=1971739 RepID=UPI00329687BE